MSRARLDATEPLGEEPEEDFTAYIRNIYKRPRRLSRTSLIAIIVGIIALLLAADALFTINRLRSSLEEMAASMRAGQAAVTEGGLERAKTEFIKAQGRASEAAALADRPSLMLASYVPIIGNDAKVLRRLPDVADQVAAGGRTAVEAARAVGATSKADFARSLFRNGRVNFATLDVGGRYVADALAHFRQAQSILTDLPQPTFTRLRNAVTDARLQLTAVQDVVERGNTLLEVLPDMMGRDSGRRYLVAFQSPNEATATGGLFALYGVLETIGGRSELVHVGPWALIQQEAITGRTIDERDPAGLAQVLEEGTAISATPSFEEFSRRQLDLYRQAKGEQLDGVLAVDPVALGYLSEATGPLEGEGINRAVTPDNAADIILRESYIRFARDPEGQTRFLQSLIQDFWDTLGTGQIDAPALIDAFGKAGRSKHLKIYSSDPDEEAALREFAMDGSFVSSEDVQFVFHNNLARNKVDYFLQREVDIRIRITRDNYALVTTKVTLHNEAPKRLPPGFGWQEDDSGINMMQLGMVLPRDSIYVGLRVDGRAAQARQDTTTTTPSYPLIKRTVIIPPKETSTVIISYRIPEATELLRGGEFEFRLFPHATLSPDEYSVTIEAPTGFQVVLPQGSAGSRIDGDARFDGVLDQEVSILVNVIPI